MDRKSPTAQPVTAKLFMNGSSQAVRLPRAFRFDGNAVNIRKEGNSVVLEPITPVFQSTAEWFAELDRLNELAGEPFMAKGREQPPMPQDRKVFE
jgi:antitoxin VapB